MPNPTVVKPFAWSYSQLKNFETCELRYYHYQVAKDVVEPETEALRAGNSLHAHFDARIRGGVKLPLGYGQYERTLARFVAAPGATYSEQKLAFSQELQPTGWFGRDVWCRVVIDAAKVREDATATVLDWKTGKPGEDLTQLQLMAATLFIHMPELQRVKSALVFVNHDKIEPAEFVRADQAEIWSELLPRVGALRRAREANSFAARPSGLCRKYCDVRSCAYHGQGTRR